MILTRLEVTRRSLRQFSAWALAMLDNPPLFLALMLGLATANAFFPLLPLETLTLAAAAWPGFSHRSPILLVTATAAGMSAGQIILYRLARVHGPSLLARLPGRKKLAHGRPLLRAKEWFARFGWPAMFLGRFIPGMGLSAVLAGGFLGYEARRMLPAIVASNLVFFTVLALAGRLLGENWPILAEWSGRTGRIMTALIGGLLAGGLFFLAWRHNRPG